MEIWRDIEGYEGLYQVSNMGRVKSLERNVVKGKGGLYKIEEKILKSGKHSGGYLYVCLYNEGKIKYYTIHRLVANAFIPNPNNFPQVNHKDEDKTNNRVENLEWCDRKYNCNYGTHNERMAKSRSKPVLQFTKEGYFIKKWESAKEVERELGISNSNITACCKGKIKTAYGFVWMYAVINGFEIDITKLKKVA
jgi:hypothetical protein